MGCRCRCGEANAHPLDRRSEAGIATDHLDAGEQGTLLQTNRTMLEKGRARQPANLPSGVKVIPPVAL